MSFDGGSQLEVHVTERPGRTISAIRVQAWHREDPGYSRVARSETGRSCVVHGLGPGRFVVRVTVNDSAEPDPRDFEINSDGASILHLDYEAP